MRVISLGWGVQSFTLAAMSALGILPPVDAAVHADTGHERRETYEFAERWTPWLEERGVRVVTVSDPIIPYVFNAKGVFIPALTARDRDVWVEGGEWDEQSGDEVWIPDGSRILAHRKGDPSGMLRRSCTHRWKIAPIRRWLQSERDKQPVEQWLGITLDEIERMRADSGVKYITNAYPFIESLDRPWTRGMVLRWLKENDIEIPVKSSCIFCPYHDRATWREIKLSDNGDWEKALEVDAAIRNNRPGYLCYLTAQRKPLDECDFRSQEDHGQLTPWEAEECSGMCFL